MIQRAIVISRAVDPEGLMLYKLQVPSIDAQAVVTAYSLTIPGIHIEYTEGQQVIITKLTTGQHFLIIGQLQRDIDTNSLTSISTNTLTVNNNLDINANTTIIRPMDILLSELVIDNDI